MATVGVPLRTLVVVLSLAAPPRPPRGDWTTLRGGPGRRPGRGRPALPLRLAWVRHFAGERLGTAMEPIVREGSVFVATHNGSLYALDAETGEPRWRFRAAGPFLQSPAAAGDAVIAACADGNVYSLDARTGDAAGHPWSPRGFSASPLLTDGVASSAPATAPSSPLM